MSLHQPKESKIETHQPISLPSLIETAVLHSAVMFPGTGRTESTLNSIKIPGIQMEWIKQEGLMVEVGKRRYLIPSANVKIVYFK